MVGGSEVRLFCLIKVIVYDTGGLWAYAALEAFRSGRILLSSETGVMIC